MTRRFDTLEDDLLRMLLEGNDAMLMILRNQLSHVVFAKEELSGSGIFITFKLAKEVVAIPGEPGIRFGDVAIELEGLTNPAGCVLFVDSGRLSLLEIYSYDEPWPENLGSYKLRYEPGPHRDMIALRSSKGWVH